MDGTGVPLVTPFEKSGEVDHEQFREVTSWITERGVDFLVPCGSNGEAELMTLDERASVVETVVVSRYPVPLRQMPSHSSFRTS